MSRETEKTILEDLASLESYVRDLFSFLPLPVCLVSSIGVIIDANPAFEQISGRSTLEIIGMPVENFFEKKAIDDLYEETVISSKVKNRHLVLFSRDKQIPISAATTLRKSDEGEIIGYFIGFSDLSNVFQYEKELEKRIRELEKFQRLTIGRELKMMELKKENEKLKKLNKKSAAEKYGS